MRTLRAPTVPVLSALLLLAALPEASAARQTRVALVPLSATGQGAARVAWRATASMARQLRKDRQVRVIVLAQRRAQRLHECLHVAHCIQAVGQKLDVRYLVAGHVTRMARETYRVDLRVIRADGEVVSSNGFDTRTGKGSHGAALALSLVRKARQVRVAAVTSSATDAPLHGAPLFSRSEAVSAAYTPEGSDGEDPLKPVADPLADPASPTAAVGPAPDAAPAATVRQEPRFRARIFSARYTHAWATFGAGLAALGAGVGFGVISSNANRAALEAEYQRAALLNHDKAKKNALVANVLYGVGGAAALSSAVMFYLAHRKEAREHRNEHNLSVQFHVAQKGGGLALGGSF